MDFESAESFDKVLQWQADASAGDRSLGVRFFVDEIEDSKATIKQGRPIFKSVEMCEIRVPGDKDLVVCERVEKMLPDPRDRFPIAYMKFKRGDKDQVVGTLLREWGLIPRTDALGYEAIGLKTVEQLAGLTDVRASDLRVSLQHRQTARNFLETAAGQAPLQAAQAELAAMKGQMEAMKDQIAAMQGSRIVGPDAPIPTGRRKPGPKPKAIAQPETLKGG